MTHVGDRMAMLRFQNSRPYNWRSDGGCGCGCGGGNFSIFNNYNMGPSFGFGGNSSLFKAGFITNMVFGCLDYAINWTGQILGWCGIGGGQETVQHEKPKKEGEKSDYEMLVQDFGSKTRNLGDGKYEVVKENGEHIVGTYDEILKATNKKGASKVGGKEMEDRGTGTKKTAEEKAQIKTDANAKIAQAKSGGKVVLPNGAQETVTVGDDGRVTITVKYKTNNNTQQVTKTITGESEQAVEQLAKYCQKIQKDIADATLAEAVKKDPTLAETVDGYKVQTSGVGKGDKTKAAYRLVKQGQDPIICESIQELTTAIAKIKADAAKRK